MPDRPPHIPFLQDSVTWKAFLPILLTMITAGGALAAFVLNMYDAAAIQRSNAVKEHSNLQHQQSDSRIDRIEKRSEERLYRIEDKLDQLINNMHNRNNNAKSP